MEQGLWRAMRSDLGRFLRWWPVRYLIGPATLATATFTPWPWKLAQVLTGVALVALATYAADRHTAAAEAARAELQGSREDLRITELLIDLVGILQHDLPGEGRLRANVMLSLLRR